MHGLGLASGGIVLPLAVPARAARHTCEPSTCRRRAHRCGELAGAIGVVRSNCLLFAWALYRRRRRKGREGYLVLRRSRLAMKAPHLLYAEKRRDGSLRVVSYVPHDPAARKCAPALFRGWAKWGDHHR